MRILLIGEYSGLHKELKTALMGLGHQVTLAAAGDFWKNFGADLNLGYGSNIFSYKARQFILPFLNLNKLRGYDVVHLVNFYTIPRIPLLNLFFVKFLKENNGLVTLAGAGDDPFFVKYSEMTMRYSPIPSHEKIDRRGRYYMRSERHISVMREFMEYVDGIIPIMYEYYSTFCAAGFSGKTSTPLPIPISCDGIETKIAGTSNKITFFHGLNRPGFKGTHIVEKCFSELMAKYPSDVKCVIAGRLPFNEYMGLLSKVDISVDQLYSYSLAMNALYSMAQGKVVVGGAEPESSILYDGELPPVYNAIPDLKSLMGVFEKILDERSNLGIIGAASRDFVATKHAPASVARKYLSYWSGLL